MSFRKEYPAIYMGNVNRNLSQQDLEHVFEPLGAFQLLKHKSGESKGWGFLCFANTANANRARAYLLSAKLMIRGLTLDIGTVRAWGTTDESLSRKMDRRLAATHPTTAPAEIKARIAKLSFSVFVGNLPNQCTKAEIHDMFSQCGEIITHFIATNPKRECLGYGFVDFYTEEAAMSAVEMFDGYGFRGRILRVDLADDVNEEVPYPAAQQPEPTSDPASTNDTIANPALSTNSSITGSWSAVISQRQQPSPALTIASSEQQPPPAIVPAVVPIPTIAPVPPRDLDATIRQIAPQLLQIALAVNAVEGLEFGLGVEAAAERLVKSNLLRTAVKGLCEKLEEKK